MENTFYNAFDLERLDTEATYPDHRSAFQIDRDRVLYTSAFRELQSKTQVFLSGEYDFYRTRLTHSLEVAQIGRSITSWLLASSDYLSESFYIDPDLVEAACLSHDLGHPPFGHAGERVLNQLMSQYGGFEGNAQTLRLLTKRIFSEKRQGMNPTRAFTDSVLKYKTLWSELGGADTPPKNHFIYDDQHSILDWTMGGNDFPPEFPAGEARDAFKSLECQIMDWADDTAYSLNDLADSVRAGFLTPHKITLWAEQQDLHPVQVDAIESLLRAIRGSRMDGFVGKRIGQHIRATTLEQDVNILSPHTNRYRYRLQIDPDTVLCCKLYKKLSYELVFLQTGLKQLEFKTQEMLEKLWKAFADNCLQPSHNQHLLPPTELQEINECESDKAKHRLLSDYFASQTDLSAKKLYLRLFDANAGSITDLYR